MSDKVTVQVASAAISNIYIMALALTVGVAFGAVWAIPVLLLGLVIFLIA